MTGDMEALAQQLGRLEQWLETMRGSVSTPADRRNSYTASLGAIQGRFERLARARELPRGDERLHLAGRVDQLVAKFTLSLRGALPDFLSPE